VIRVRSLVVGGIAWLAAIAMTPGELVSSKRHASPDARTAVTLVLWAVACVGILRGLPRDDAPPPPPAR
jgi:hypothetical protein